MDFESTAVEPTEVVTGEEVAEPQVEETQSEGSNESVLAEQTSEDRQDSRTNKAFQEMRHRNEELARELATLKAEASARESTYGRLMGDADDISVIANATGMSEEAVQAEFESARESLEKDARIEELEGRINEIEAEKMMAEDLQALRRIDPSLKNLDELGESYVNYIEAGLTAEQAYWAIKAKETANKATPPKEIGKIGTGVVEKEYYTQDEINAMSSDELSKNWKKIMKSWER